MRSVASYISATATTATQPNTIYVNEHMRKITIHDGENTFSIFYIKRHNFQLTDKFYTNFSLSDSLAT